MKRKNLGRAVLVLFLLLPALAVWWPLWFMGTGALMPLDELRAALGPVLQGAEGSAFWPLLPSWPTLQPLAELLLDTPQFFTMFWNTCAIVFPQVLGQVLVGAPAAWAFSRLRFRGRRALFTLYIVLMLMPFQVTMVSGYLVADAMGIMDTFWAIILPGVFSTFPVFIMAKGFDAVPIALLEAASIDGAGPLRTFFHIGVPLGVPGILSAAVLGFLEAWNAIEQPMTFLKTKALWPLSLYLPQIAAEKLGLAMVASLVMLAPAVLIFRFGQKYLEEVLKNLAEKWDCSYRIVSLSQGYESSPDGEMLKILEEATLEILGKTKEEAEILPFVSMGSSDGRFLADLDTKVYGYSPVYAWDMTFDSAVTMVHGINERIHRDSVVFGSKVLTLAVCRAAQSGI